MEAKKEQEPQNVTVEVKPEVIASEKVQEPQPEKVNATVELKPEIKVQQPKPKAFVKKASEKIEQPKPKAPVVQVNTTVIKEEKNQTKPEVEAVKEKKTVTNTTNPEKTKEEPVKDEEKAPAPGWAVKKQPVLKPVATEKKVPVKSDKEKVPEQPEEITLEESTW